MKPKADDDASTEALWNGPPDARLEMLCRGGGLFDASSLTGVPAQLGAFRGNQRVVLRRSVPLASVSRRQLQAGRHLPCVCPAPVEGRLSHAHLGDDGFGRHGDGVRCRAGEFHCDEAPGSSRPCVLRVAHGGACVRVRSIFDLRCTELWKVAC